VESRCRDRRLLQPSTVEIMISAPRKDPWQKRRRADYLQPQLPIQEWLSEVVGNQCLVSVFREQFLGVSISASVSQGLSEPHSVVYIPHAGKSHLHTRAAGG
jgi:hypothetical protein